MQKDVIDSIKEANNTAFIDFNTPCEENFRTKLILNDNPNKKILSTILKELRTCTSFEWSVAFITEGGLQCLLNTLKELEEKNIPGRIITTTYLEFTNPYVIEKLHTQFKNIQIKVSQLNFHAKGYSFNHENYNSTIIGSANLTAAALNSTKELNILINSTKKGEILNELQKEFKSQWENASDVSPAFLDHYKKIWENTNFKKNNQTHQEEISQTIKPNSMQITALQALEELRKKGLNKALIVSATGTGKTFLCAFDVKSYKPKTFLYIVHREMIANKSMESFKAVLGEDLKCSIFGGGKENIEKPFQFSMIQTLANNLDKFSPNHFDYIIVDEAHRVMAPSYQKVLNYFKPKFLLGMTATPERTDNQEIYSMFGNNIAYEIRLNQALEENLLCDFHYYGITDWTINGESVDENTKLNSLVSPIRANHIKETLNLYTFKKEKARGLIFCSRNEEAKQLCIELNNLGIKTITLDGNNSEEEREDAINKLESYQINYIITVDIFNEGVDIPFLNQILMLRPTKSAIIFVQQLGRGLRKFPDKNSLTVIDFIGNYENNFFIPIALFGDSSYKKDNLRKHLVNGNLGIYGNSTIDFDRIAKQRIYDAIDKANFSRIKFLKEQYLELKRSLNRIPKLIDFETQNTISPLMFLNNINYKTYYELKAKFESLDLTNCKLSKTHLQSLSFFSKILPEGLRLEETVIIKLLLDNKTITIDDIQKYCINKYNLPSPSIESINSAIWILTNNFLVKKQRDNFGNISYIQKIENKITKTNDFINLFQNKIYLEELQDLIEVSEAEYLHYAKAKDALLMENGLILYRKYMRRDVIRLLNWKKNEEGTVNGYKIDKETNTCPLFVTYYKDSENISSSIDYADRFVSEKEFIWESKSNRTVSSQELKPLINQINSKVKILLFIQKSNNEGSDFYYMGNLETLSQKNLVKNDSKNTKVVEFHYKMENPVSFEIYSYITSPVLKTNKGKDNSKDLDKNKIV